jgi:hypothetical protein
LDSLVYLRDWVTELRPLILTATEPSMLSVAVGLGTVVVDFLHSRVKERPAKLNLGFW